MSHETSLDIHMESINEEVEFTSGAARVCSRSKLGKGRSKVTRFLQDINIRLESLSPEFCDLIMYRHFVDVVFPFTLESHID